MDMNKLTQKSQEAVQRAQDVAVRYGHQELDGEHLLLALVDEPEGLVPRLFQKMDVALDSFRQALGQALERRPRVSGPGAEAGKIFVTQRFQQLVARRPRTRPSASRTSTSRSSTCSSR